MIPRVARRLAGARRMSSMHHHAYPYRPGNSLELTWCSPTDSSRRKIQATIRKTLSDVEANGCVMLVDFAAAPHGSDSFESGLPPTATLKLFDRRFCDGGSNRFDRPWTPEVEDTYRRAWVDIECGRRSIPARVRSLHALDEDEEDWSHVDDWDIEMFRWDRLMRMRQREEQAYRRLRPLWGQGVPTFYGTVELELERELGRSSEAHASIKSVFGIVLEYLEGESLDLLPDSDQSVAPTEQDQARGHNALNILRRAHALGVAHRDVVWQNVLRRPDGEYAIIDWGFALVRGVGDSDADWLAKLAECHDLFRLRNVLGEKGYYDPSPVDVDVPERRLGFMQVNNSATDVKCPRRRDAWFERVPCPAPGWKEVRLPGDKRDYIWEYRKYRVRPGVRQRDMHNGEYL